jgi:hypothetical protein
MVFLTIDDFDKQIRSENLDRIIDSNSVILDDAEASAILRATGYLDGRYDMPAEFAKSGTDRNALLVTILIDLVLYDVHSRINPRNVPELRMARRDEATDLLKKTNEEKLNNWGLTERLNADGEEIEFTFVRSNVKNQYLY